MNNGSKLSDYEYQTLCTELQTASEVIGNIPTPIRGQREILDINHFTPAGRIYINANYSIKLCTEFGVLIVYLILRPPRVSECFQLIPACWEHSNINQGSGREFGHQSSHTCQENSYMY